jgi:hypothetical protein
MPLVGFLVRRQRGMTKACLHSGHRTMDGAGAALWQGIETAIRVGLLVVSHWRMDTAESHPSRNQQSAE